jgi:hypothetical protein
MNEIFSRTQNALGKDFLNLLADKKYCIVGCGGIGANFAEMLARTGAKHINLIDADKVELSNLNRVFNFYENDKGKYKVEVVRSKLEKINSKIKGEDSKFFFQNIPEGCNEEDREGFQRSRNIVCDSHIILIFCDDNKTRLLLEKFCGQETKKYLSAAIRIDPVDSGDILFFECGWFLKTPESKKDSKGYPNNASLASIIMEATSVVFSMMLANLKNDSKSSKFFKYRKTYKSFVPSKIEINGKTIYPKNAS